METITQIKKLIIHPALGWLLKVVLSNGNQYNIYCEWFFHLDSEWDGDSEGLVGKEVSEEWCKSYNENLD
jgi:hypothetical protein